MSRKIFALLTVTAVTASIFAMPIPNDERKAVYEAGKKLEGIFQRPKSKSGSPKTLILCGQRPWLGNDMAKNLIDAGCDVNVLTGPYLAGLSGSYIRSLPHEKFEPTPVDAITPEFNHLSDYNLILINGIPAENQKKIFTPERIEKLKTFLKNGGDLVLTVNAPAELGDILPVHLGEKNPPPKKFFALRPTAAPFVELPDSWQVFDAYRDAELADGATLLSAMVDENKQQVGIYMASKPYGKGKVIFLNSENIRTPSARSLHYWGYKGMLFIALASEASGEKLSTAKTLFKKQASDAPKTIEKTTLELRNANMLLADIPGNCTVNDNREIKFANGTTAKIKGGKVLDIYLAGSKKPYLSNISIPQLILSSKQNDIEDSSAEAVGMDNKNQTLKASWNLTDIKTGETAILVWTADDGTEIEQEIKTATLDLDGKIYRGVAIRARVTKSAKMVSGFKFEQKVDVNNKKMRRFACYQPPRGYAEYDLTDKKDDDTREWGIFSSGQPFGWVEGADGVYTVFIGDIQNATLQLKQKANSKKCDTIINNIFGFKKAPQSSAWFYHLVGPAEVADNNGWMAMYQFQRHYLRKKANIKEVPAYPAVTYSAYSKAERLKTIEKAGKAGMRYFHIPTCPSTMDEIDSPGRLATIKRIIDNGMTPYTWSPCGHSHGSSDWIKAQKHWLAYKVDGKPFTYFGGNFPVIDQSNPDFLKWYLPKVQKSIDAGLRGFWFDMGGAATGTRNFAKDEDDTGLKVLVDTIYPLFYNQGGWIATEGQNPLVLDGFWYRARVYTSMANKEFAFIGAFPCGDGFDFDYIRSSMFGTFYSAVLFDNYGEKFERVTGEAKQLNDVAHYTPFICEVLDTCGMPFIRETDFGTSWISDKGGALFFYNAVNDFSAKLPDGMTPVKMITEKDKNIELNGKMPITIPQRSIILLKKTK